MTSAKNSPPSKIILSCCAPNDLRIPSVPQSVLKSFLKAEGFDASCEYWSLRFLSTFPEMEHQLQVVDEEASLLPFLHWINREHQADQATLDLLAGKFFAAWPQTDVRRGFDPHQFLSDQLARIDEILTNRLSEIVTDDLLLFGLPGKHHQWVSSLYLARRLKERHPDARTVIGGFLFEDTALTFMERFSDFDYAVWGEGEHPLVGLARYLRDGGEDLSKVPRLIYREGDRLSSTHAGTNDYLSFENYSAPDFVDYFDTVRACGLEELFRGRIKLPIEGSRGCPWNLCHFCNDSSGYRVRARKADDVVREIEQQSQKYENNGFYFTDLDVLADDPERLQRMLTLIEESSQRRGIRYQFGGYYTHKLLTGSHLEMMKRTGWDIVQIGFEAASDGLLAKFKKSTNFAHNLLYLKFACKQGIVFQTEHIIVYFPGETTADVLDSIRNLRFMRFYLGDSHQFAYQPFELTYRSPYFVKSKERGEYTKHNIGTLLPDAFYGNYERSRFFSHSSQRVDLNSEFLWHYFDRVQKHHVDNKASYTILEESGKRVIVERAKDEEALRWTIPSELHWDALCAANRQAISLSAMLPALQVKHPSLDKQALIEVLNELQDRYYLYATGNRSAIVSVIDTDRPPGAWS